jgi:hypothetical protein
MRRYWFRLLTALALEEPHTYTGSLSVQSMILSAMIDRGSLAN